MWRKMKFKYPKWAKLRAQVFKRDNFTCQHCGWRPMAIPDLYDGRYTVGWPPLHLDHIKPLDKGGNDDINNLQTLCESCNKSKGGKYVDIRASQKENLE